MKITEEKVLYCSSCGSANEMVVKCVECGKDIRLKRYPFLDFLKKHTIEKFISELEDAAFKTIKKYILSHLYGIIVTVAIFSSITALVRANTVPPYVTQVSGGVNAFVTEKKGGPAITLPTDEEFQEFRELSSDYVGLCDINLGVPYINKRTMSLESLMAESTGKFPYKGVHEVKERGLAAELPWDDEEKDPYSIVQFEDVLVNELLTNELAIRLRDDGYRVIQGTYNYWGFTDGRPKDIMWSDRSKSDIKKHVEMVCVEIDGKWYVAEDIIHEGVTS